MLVGVLVGSAIAYYLYREFYGKRKNLPPGPTPWPIVGNILQLDQAHPEKTLSEWGKKYGPVFTIWLPQPMVIIGDYEMMKETFLKRGDAFAGRPELFLFKELLNGNYGLVFSSGKMWRENRRFSLHALRDFGIGRNSLEPQIMDQAHQLVAYLHDTAGNPVALREPFTVRIFRHFKKLRKYINKISYRTIVDELRRRLQYRYTLGRRIDIARLVPVNGM